MTREDCGSGRYQTHIYSNGYLAKTTCVWGDDGSGTTTYTWSNGNMVKEVSEWEYNNTHSETTYTYTYGNVENKLNVNIFNDFYDVELLVFNGTRIKNLPTSYTWSDGETETYSYTYDDDGYPIKRVTNDGGSSVTTITYY